MHLARSIQSLIFSALLALGVIGTGLAQGQSPAAGTEIFCIGDTVVTIMVDAEGQPTHTPHICPDCIALALDETGQNTHLHWPARTSLSASPLGVAVLFSRTGLHPPARGPPALF